MPSVTQSINSGLRIGRAFSDPAPAEPSKMQSYVMKELIEGAYGLFRRKDGSVYVPQSIPKEARSLAIYKFIEKEKQAGKELFQERKDQIAMVGTLWKKVQEVQGWEKTSPEAKKNAIDILSQTYASILGDTTAEELGVGDISDVVSDAVDDQSRQKAFDQKIYEIQSGLLSKYHKTGDIDYLNAYTRMFGTDPEKFAAWGMPNPQPMTDKHFDKKKKEVEAEAKSKKELEQYEATKQIESKYRQRDAKPFLLPSGQSVLSLDGGRTFKDANGKEQPMPTGAIPISAKVTGEDVQLIRRQEKIRERIGSETPPETPTAKEMRIAAESATGPWANLRAAIDAVAGGVGIDKAFGKNGFFKDTQDNRQLLRLIKQTTKAALLNSSRGAVWELKLSDDLYPDPSKFAVNPATEARKFDTLRKIFITEIYLNNRAILSATNPKAADKLAQSNLEMERLLDLIGREDTTTPKKENLEEKYGIKLTQ